MTVLAALGLAIAGTLLFGGSHPVIVFLLILFATLAVFSFLPDD